MTEIMYYPLIDCDTEGTEQMPMFPTPKADDVKNTNRMWLEEMIPNYFRLYAKQGTQPADNFQIRCPRCGKVLDRIGREINETKLGLYVCSSCTKN